MDAGIHKDLLDDFEKSLEGKYSAEDKAFIMKAAVFADNAHKDQLRKSGEPYIIHPFSVAKILVDLNMDKATIAAGLLHDVIEDTPYTYKDIETEFSPTVANIVEGVTKIEAIQVKSSSEAESETIRKMFFAMSKDPRVIIVKLADKLHNMRTLQFLLPARSREIARECLDVFAPLADRLGISTLKADLEDEALRILHPDVYILISEHMRSHYSERTEFLKEAEEKIREKLEANNIHNYKINTRIKHPYSIYTKMRRRGKEIGEIFDVLGCRIVCTTVSECYTILGLVHTIWPPVEGRFKDYIAMPKANNYQSLHTTVLSKGASLLEIQICTYEMEAVAAFGVASHWSYKAASGSSSDSSASKKTMDEGYQRLMARLASWSDEIKENDSFMDEIKGDMLRDTIVVFTPKGKSVELPLGSTALDFAYLIHTEIGNTTLSAKANGKIIPLSEPLENTDVIEIITSPKAHPRENWLKYAHTLSARRKIKAWLNKNDENILFQQNLIVKQKENQKHLDEEHTPQLTSEDEIVTSRERNEHKGSGGLKLGSEKNIMVSFAHCCNPVKGDPIVGYVSRGRGIIVHRKDCKNLPNMSEIADRIIDVEWDSDTPSVIKRFRLTSRRTFNIFTEIENAIKRFSAHLVEGRLDDDDGVSLVGTFMIEATNDEEMKKVIKAVRSMPNIDRLEML